MKANDVIRIGRSRSRQASITASSRALSFELDVARELDDQDGVLGRQPHQHHEADLGQDVDVLPHDPHADGRGEQAHRHDQDDRERQAPAAVLRRQHQKHEQHADREHEEAGVAAGDLLIATGRSIRSEKPLGSVSSASFFMMLMAVAELVPGSVSPCNSDAG